MKEEIRIYWETQKLEDVIHYFEKDFNPVAGEVFKVEHWIDVAKGEVVFRLLVKHDKPCQHRTATVRKDSA